MLRAALLDRETLSTSPANEEAEERYVEPAIVKGLRWPSAAPLSLAERFVGATFSAFAHGLVAVLLLTSMVKPMNGPVLDEIPVEIVVEASDYALRDSAAEGGPPAHDAEAIATLPAEAPAPATAETERPSPPWDPAPPDSPLGEAEASPPVPPNVPSLTAEASLPPAAEAPAITGDAGLPAAEDPTPAVPPVEPAAPKPAQLMQPEPARRIGKPAKPVRLTEAARRPRKEEDAKQERAEAVQRAARERRRTASRQQASLNTRDRAEKAQAATRQSAALRSEPRAGNGGGAAQVRQAGAGRPRGGTQQGEGQQPNKAAGAAASGADVASYRARVIAHLARFKRYPPGAEARGAEGNPAVAFSLEGSGGIVAVSLARSSGHSDIDTEALAMVRRAVPFPAPPPGAPRSISATIGFQLR